MNPNVILLIIGICILIFFLIKKKKNKEIAEEQAKQKETQTKPIIVDNNTINRDEVEGENPNKEQSNNSTCIDVQSEIVLLWLLSQKKEPTTNNFKITKKISNRYNLDLNIALSHLINEKLISNINDKLVIEERGFLKLKEFNCCIIMHLHPEYELSINDFISNPYWHKIKDNDIIWGIFNSRILDYTKAKKWSSLSNTYSNMATLLIEESNFERAMDFIFASTFLQTSGMEDDNILTTYHIEISNYTVTAPLIEISRKLNLNIKDLQKKFYESQIVLSLIDLLPFYYYDMENSCKFMIEALNQGETKGIFTEQALKNHLIKNVPDQNETSKYFYNSIENILKKQFNS